MTPQVIINLALKLNGIIGVGQTPLPEDINDAFILLNSMVHSWNRRRWMIYHEVDIACIGNGSPFYTIGAGQQFNVTRPAQIQSAYVRLKFTSNSPVDVPLSIIDSHEEYSAISLKSLVAYPRSIFYDSGYPVGNVYVYPIPTSNYEIHLILSETITQFTNLTTDINLPPVYQEALTWNLAARLRPFYGLQLDPTIHGIALQALSVVRTSNFQMPKLGMPVGLGSRNTGAYPSHGVGGISEGVFTTDESVLG